jgi:hypothetical protein
MAEKVCEESPRVRRLCECGLVLTITFRLIGPNAIPTPARLDRMVRGRVANGACRQHFPKGRNIPLLTRKCRAVRRAERLLPSSSGTLTRSWYTYGIRENVVGELGQRFTTITRETERKGKKREEGLCRPAAARRCREGQAANVSSTRDFYRGNG